MLFFVLFKEKKKKHFKENKLRHYSQSTFNTIVAFEFPSEL